MEQSILSSMSATTNDGRLFDTGKINQLFDKIERANNLEIEERSIKNLAQKLQLKLIDAQTLSLNHGQQLGALLGWINKRQLDARPASIQACLQVFQHISTAQEGRNVLKALGADAFFNEFHRMAHSDHVQQQLEQIMTSLISETTIEPPLVQNPFATQFPANANGTISHGQQTINSSVMDQVPLREQDPLAATVSQPEPANQFTMQSFGSPHAIRQAQVTGRQGSCTNVFNRTDFSISKNTQVQATAAPLEMSVISRMQVNQVGETMTSFAAPQQPQQMNQSIERTRMTQVLVQNSASNNSRITGAYQATGGIAKASNHSKSISSHSSFATSGGNELHSTHMEMLHKQQTLKESCELPFVHLTEDDEKKLFDLSVQLKFGDFRTVLLAIRTLLDTVLLDYPVEVLLQRSDIIKSLLDLLEGGSGATSGHSTNEAYTNLAQQALVAITRRLRNTYRFLTNNTMKPSHISSGRYLGSYQSSGGGESGRDAASEVKNLEYLKLSYPGLADGVWNTHEAVNDLKKYGAQMPNDRVAAASTQGSLSCRAALGLILTKAIYMLKDTEKLGLYTQLIKEALAALMDIFRVESNCEFTEMIHLCLIAFDSVCDFYRDQIFTEILISVPVLDMITQFLSLLNSIGHVSSGSQGSRDRFRQPFTETLFKSTERLQMTLRRALFTSALPSQDKEKVILDFFARMEADLPDINLLQKNVSQSYGKAQACFKHFEFVHNFRIKGSGAHNEDITFVDSLPQLNASLEVLEHLTHCIEMKINFPFEHILLDCMVHANLLALQNSQHGKIDQIEQLAVTYLSLPNPEVRERILRRLYQRLRVVEAFQKERNPHQANNNYLLAKFLYRKKVVNQLVNGLLINQEIANEESKLQMTIGQLLIKCLIAAFNEGGQTQVKQNGLNQFLLTFQSLMPQYPELIGLIDLIEANVDRNCRFLRMLRDLFSQNASRREFATNALIGNMAKEYSQTQSGGSDLLSQVVNLSQPMQDVSNDLDLVNLNYDFTNFDIVNITSILQNATSDYSIRKSSLEQLTLLLFDCDQKRGKVLFVNRGVDDVFTFVLGELLAAYRSGKTYLNESLEGLAEGQIEYLEQCLRFVFFAYIFYHDEPVIRATFDKIRSFSMPQRRSDPQQLSSDSKAQEFEQILSALVFFAGSQVLRRNAVRVLYLTVLHPFWLKFKSTKQQATQWRTKRIFSVLVPDFCQDSFVMLIPYQPQVVKMPLRADMLLSEEQKNYIAAAFNSQNKLTANRDVLSQVAHSFVRERQASASSSGGANFNKVMQSWETLQNYLLATSDASQELISAELLTSLQDLIRMLPSRDFEFNFLADFFMNLNQILTVAPNLTGYRQIESLVATLCEALKFHLLPYLFEVNLSGLEECICDQHNSRIFFLHEFFEFLCQLASTDIMLRDRHHVKSCLQDRVLTSHLISYLQSMHQFLKEKPDLRRKILTFLSTVLTSYDTSHLVLENTPDLLVSLISNHRLNHSFDGHSQLISGIRSLLIVYQRRLTHIDLHGRPDRFGYHEGDLPQTKSLSQTTAKHLEQFTTSGWLVRFTECRDARLRVLAWDLLTEIFDYGFLKKNPSLAQQSINVLLRDGELYSVKIAAVKFLNKVCDSLIHNCDATQDINNDMHDHVEDRKFIGSDIEHITVKTLLHVCNRQGLISHVHGILEKKDCPIVMISLTLRLLSRLIQMDFRRSLPVLTQLDYWTILVDLIDVKALKLQDHVEDRSMIQHLKTNLLREMPYPFDQVYMTINSLLEFIFEAFKRDSQLAALLVKTTKLLPTMFSLLKFTLDNVSSFREANMVTNPNLPIRNKGLLTIFVDKMVKLLHMCLLHPRDYSIDLIAKFLTQVPPEEAACGAPTVTRNWIYILKLYRLVGSQHSNFFYGHIDVKLAICRFVAELLIRMPQSNFKEHYLDETVRGFDGDKYVQLGYLEDAQEIETFGGLLLIEFGQVFRALYVDLHDQRQQAGVPRDLQDHENSKIDICLCLSILMATSEAAKVQSLEQNLLKKVIEICSENVSALHLSELQRFTQKSTGPSNRNSHSQATSKTAKQAFQAQFNRKYRYAKIDDLEMCEREVMRMMSLIRHIFYRSGFLLIDELDTSKDRQTASTTGRGAPVEQEFQQSKSFINQNAQVHVHARAANKKQGGTTIFDQLITLYASVLEQLGVNSRFQCILEECLRTMITMASQNVKFKNVCIAQLPATSQQSRKGSLLRILTGRLMAQNIQTNSEEMQLIFAMFKTLAMSAEITKELMKQRTIEDLHTQLAPACKNEKDIKILKGYLINYLGFLAAFASTDEGQRAILRCKPVFEMSLFIMDTITPPAAAQERPGPTSLSILLTYVLLFLRNSSFNRTNKLHFLSDYAFLPCLMAFISSRTQHPRVRAYAAACLWSVLYNHQGVKAAINTNEVRGELALLQSEFQRTADIANYARYIDDRALGRPDDEDSTSMMDRSAERETRANKRMATFTSQAISGILNLLEA